eukprot:5007416-Amphidinium_carterae.1
MHQLSLLCKELVCCLQSLLLCTQALNLVCGQPQVALLLHRRPKPGHHSSSRGFCLLKFNRQLLIDAGVQIHALLPARSVIHTCWVAAPAGLFHGNSHPPALPQIHHIRC